MDTRGIARQAGACRSPDRRAAPILEGVKPLKRSIALLIRRDRATGPVGELESPVLVVRRPPDDDDLPGVWGLPAGTLREGEGWEEAVRRAGLEKLGVRVRPGEVLAEGELEREAYRLHMRLFAASIESGAPSVPQAVEGVTQYDAWAWAPVERLEPAARAGSLCSRLGLSWAGRGW
jgi:ADP-ribose pyrophosphatase YjhB (NUDIX family)